MSRCYETLKKRSSFVSATKAKQSVSSKGLVIQKISLSKLQKSEISQSKKLRVGFTATKKVGGAIIRNRIKRRLRALMDEVLKTWPKTTAQREFLASHAFIVIGRHSTTDRDYTSLKKDAHYVLHRLYSASQDVPRPQHR